MSSINSITSAFYALEVDYWYDVDHNWGRKAHEFYTPAGVFVIGDKRMAGREEVRGFYGWREGRGERTARHVISNIRVRSTGPEQATLECIMSLYAADGAPVLESRPPIMIADIFSECVYQGGKWLYTLHELRPLFMGGEAPTLPPDK
ncbi:MAG: nuclear transport factor 2 family protein [Burkholderiales bacterium]